MSALQSENWIIVRVFGQEGTDPEKKTEVGNKENSDACIIVLQ